MEDVIKKLVLNQEYNIWKSYECPFCISKKGRPILSIKKTYNYIKYKCWSTKCAANRAKYIPINGNTPENVRDMLLPKEKFDKNRRYQLPPTYVNIIPKKFIDYLNKYHIDDYLIRLYKIGYCAEHYYKDKLIFEDRLIIPTPSGFVARSLSVSDLIKLGYTEAEAKDLCGELPKWKNFSDYNFRSIDSPKSDTIVLVEDPLSCIRVGEVLPTYCLLGTKLVEKIMFNLLNYKKVLIWLDNDVAGKKASKKIKSQLDPYIKTKIITTSNDPKFYTKLGVKEVLNAKKI